MTQRPSASCPKLAKRKHSIFWPLGHSVTAVTHSNVNTGSSYSQSSGSNSPSSSSDSSQSFYFALFASLHITSDPIPLKSSINCASYSVSPQTTLDILSTSTYFSLVFQASIFSPVRKGYLHNPPAWQVGSSLSVFSSSSVSVPSASVPLALSVLGALATLGLSTLKSYGAVYAYTEYDWFRLLINVSLHI
jgi:hypothetical protein